MDRTHAQLMAALDPADPSTIRNLIDHHRRLFAGWTMKDGDDGDSGDKAGDDKSGDSGDSGDQSGKDKDQGDNTGDKAGDDKSGKSGQQNGSDDWKGKFEGQQKVNRDLETKMNQIRNGLAQALGVEEKKTSVDDLVSSMQKQLQEIERKGLVYDIAAEHKITDKDDLALLREQPTEDAMRKLAGRLKPSGDEDGDDDRNGRGKSGTSGRPKGDKSQGRGSSSGGRSGSVAQVMADRRAAREAKK